MNDENRKSLDELREFTKNADSKLNQAPEPRHRTEKALTWKDIALGVYVGGIALAATSVIFWLIFVRALIAAITGK